MDRVARPWYTARFTRDCVCTLAEWPDEPDLQDVAVSAMALGALALNTDAGGEPLEPWARALLSKPGGAGGQGEGGSDGVETSAGAAVEGERWGGLEAALTLLAGRVL